MFLQQNQFIGNACESFNGFQYGENGYYSGTGYWTGNGVWTGNGFFSGSGCITGSGYFTLFNGNFSGYVPGFQPNGYNLIGNGLPFTTISGDDNFTSDGLVTLDGSTYFGRNGFVSSGIISGYENPNGLYTGCGNFIGSGNFIIDGDIVNFGSMEGNGTVSGQGFMWLYPYPLLVPTCTGCFPNYIMSGDGWITGSFSGQGNSQTWSTGQGLLSGSGSYYVSGLFSGYSPSFFWGFGSFSGENITAPTGTGGPQSYYGIGPWSGYGWLQAQDGQYSGQGTAINNGTSYGFGHSQWSNSTLNVVSGSGCFAGYGTYELFNTGGLATGIYCQSFDAEEIALMNSGCGSFPTGFLTNCNQIGQIAIAFSYVGNCQVQGLQ